MRFRGKSIRRKIVALLLVPLVALTVMWAFISVLTGSQANQLLDVGHVIKKVGHPVEDAILVLQSERRQTLIYLSDPRAADSLTELRSRRADTDAALALVKRNATLTVRDRMDPTTSERFTILTGALDGLDLMRRSVDESTVTRERALDFYNQLVDPGHSFLASLYGHEDVDGDNWGRALVGLGRAKEMLSREDAVVASALTARRLTATDIRSLSDLVAGRTVLYQTNLSDLPLTDRVTLEQYWRTPATLALRQTEDDLVEAGPSDDPKAVDMAHWQKMTAPVLEDLTSESAKADALYRAHIDPVRQEVFIRLILAGTVGFVALLVSVIVSVRVGRDLVRDLTQLRKEAHEVSGVRLPSVMRRLAAGEQVDVETEAPRLDYERDEVGQVGQALNTLQRAAVEAAVKQADLRRGVSEVFVNLARRNQVLLHRQLTLLDTMERRTEDTEELADLFRLDHLTTRMRRHAEGLVILSGAAPSRQWRKPVQLMDVVRAAVAEVEDYERIEVRRLPRIGVGGPAVADLTHLIAELLENATVFSPPHTAVQVHGERVANGFTLEIHDRGLGMAPEVLLDANLRLAETPEFELSDTDRLGLFVVSRLAQRQNVRVSLQPSPYGGTTAIVFLPVALLTDAPETEGTGFRLDRKRTAGGGRHRADGGTGRRTALAQVPTGRGSGPSVLDGPVELEAPVGTLGIESGPVLGGDGILGGGDGIADLDDTESERGGLFRAREHLRDSAGDPRDMRDARDIRETREVRDVRDVRDARDGGRDFRDRRDGRAAQEPRGLHEQHQQTADPGPQRSGDPVGLPRRKPPTLVVDRGRRLDEPGRASSARDAREARDSREQTAGGTGRTWSGVPAQLSGSGASRPAGSGASRTTEEALPLLDGLPRRIRQASLAPQLRDITPDRSSDQASAASHDTERDADEVRSRMASLQRGWQRGRRQNDAEDSTGPGDTQGTTSEGDGR
ncbi:nitrate- and nitrite sensing domain-containing protein [Streptomyces sp. NPDC059568]|uniref:sensor histidine kinase n=1 Tax=Streptomyces sp. NPDC059568 TaxID=3346868 RepID=UPI00368615C8